MLFPKGTVLWRQVTFVLTDDQKKFKSQLESVEFEPTDKQNYMARMKIESQWMYEPEVYSPNAGEDRTKGFVVFAADPPPDDWTHLIVTGVGKALHQVGWPSKGTCVFGKWASPFEKEAYMEFRKQLFLMKWRFQNQKNPAEVTFNDIIAASEKVTLPGLTSDEQRLIVRYHQGDRQNIMDYLHLRSGKKAESEVKASVVDDGSFESIS